jgi:hypothetical protein
MALNDWGSMEAAVFEEQRERKRFWQMASCSPPSLDAKQNRQGESFSKILRIQRERSQQISFPLLVGLH